MEKYFIAALTSVEQLGSKRALQLIRQFGSAQAAWTAPEGALLDSGLPDKVVQSLLNRRQRFPNMVEEIMARCDAKGIRLCSIDDEEYPDDLRKIADAPVMFYYKGTLCPSVMRISMVGTREVSRYGEKVTLELAGDLARAGITIVSGGASGIDTFAHRGALKQGRTVAVLGCGLECIYPSENRRLFDQIVECGALISEYPPKTPPSRGQFPRRNRIIAGLSKGVVVVEAGDTSGALNTAQHALNYSRKLFAVPGSIYAEKSRGCNELIHNYGAVLVRGAQDVLNAYNVTAEIASRAPAPDFDEKILDRNQSDPPQISNQNAAPELEGDEALAYSLVDEHPTDIDGLMNRCDRVSDRNFSSQELSNIMLMLGFKGLVIEDELGNYSRR